jgi:uncharacterized protein YdiU (UPF0061 family)
LADYTIKFFFPSLLGDQDPNETKSIYVRWLSQVVDKTAFMISRWQAFGFCHGVMNTDNFSILGLTIDYGPFQFLDKYDPSYICNSSDHTGRYSFENQPNIALWNLSRLASAISPLINYSDKSRVETELVECIKEFGLKYDHYYSDIMLNKLGISSRDSVDKDMKELVYPLLEIMAELKLDYTNFFRTLCEKDLVNYKHQKLQSWIELYRERCKTRDLECMKKVNPKAVLRNLYAQEVIESVENGNVESLNQLLAILSNPFKDDIPNTWTREPTTDLRCSCSS